MVLSYFERELAEAVKTDNVERMERGITCLLLDGAKDTLTIVAVELDSCENNDTLVRSFSRMAHYCQKELQGADSAEAQEAGNNLSLLQGVRDVLCKA